MHRFIIAFTICFIFSSSNTYAQLIRRYHAHSGQLPPKALLVRLSTEKNRREFYLKHHDFRNLEIIEKDATEQRARMVSDFKDHFTFCPVYFFYDTTQDQIKAHNFSVLLDNDLKPATNMVIGPGDSSYFIVYYGYEQEEPEKKGHEGAFSSGYSGNSVKTLVALDCDFVQLSLKLPYKAGPVRRLNSKKDPTVPAYEYKSKKFDISYEPYAILYDRNLRLFYRQR
ncbi:MAG: hypothetical protein P4L41_05790 [Flavipsychrobacter sp.]|nr:hypothetical protein [Flavipsychrobacter sp.]